jgi:hypothetical protein
VTNMVERLSLISTPHEQLGLTVPPLLVAGADGLTSVDGACCICSRQQLADFVAKVGEELPGYLAAKAGAARFCRSPGRSGSCDALIPTPATQLERYTTLTQHTRQLWAAIALAAWRGGVGSERSRRA